MVKRLLIALWALWIVALPGASVGQMTNAPDFSFARAQPIACSAGYYTGCVFEPTLKVGYKRLGLNFDAPIAARQVLREVFPGFPLFQQYASLLDVYPLDIKLEKANLLVGGLGLRLTNPRTGLAGFFNVAASSPRSVSLTSSTGPGIGQIPPAAVSWSGSQFQWNEYDLGGSYRVRNSLGILGGVKFERSSVKFSEPNPVPEYTTIFLPQTYRFANYGGDFQALFTKPYVGIEVFGDYFKGSLVVGAANADVKLPLRLTHEGVYIGLTIIPAFPIFSFSLNDLVEQATYSLKQAGVFVEANLESTFTVQQNIDINLWVHGAVTRVRGDANVNLGGNTTGIFRFILFPSPFRFPTNFSDGGTAESTINQYEAGCGANAVLRF